MNEPNQQQILNTVRQLAMLVRLGYPLGEGLKSMSSDASPWLGKLADDMDQGDSLSQALGRQPRLFSPFFQRMVEAAQSSPQPEAALDGLSHWLERSDALHRKINTVLLYPLLVTSVFLLFVGLLFIDIWPNGILPLATAAGRPLSPWLAQLSWLALPLILAAAFLAAAGATGRVPKFLLGLLPGLRSLRQVAAQSLWARSFGALLGAGVSPVEALQKSIVIVEEPSLRGALEVAVEETRRGSTLARAVGQCAGVEPHLLWALESGESSEDLAPRLLHVADELEREIDYRGGHELRLLAPRALLLLGGLTILGILLFWWPFYSLTILL